MNLGYTVTAPASPTIYYGEIMTNKADYVVFERIPGYRVRGEDLVESCGSLGKEETLVVFDCLLNIGKVWRIECPFDSSGFHSIFGQVYFVLVAKKKRPDFIKFLQGKNIYRVSNMVKERTNRSTPFRNPSAPMVSGLTCPLMIVAQARGFLTTSST